MTQLSIFPPLHVSDKSIRLIELFAGIGAQAKALKNLGVKFEHYRICELDRYAVASYNAVHGTSYHTSDVSQLHGSELGIEDIDMYNYIVTYSFPCTDLSPAGKQRGMRPGSETKSSLLWHVSRLLHECHNKPQVLLMENVPQILNRRNIDSFNLWLDHLNQLGYNSTYAILNSADYGVAQNRKRFYMVSYLGDYSYAFPEPMSRQRHVIDYLCDKVDPKLYLSDRLLYYYTNISKVFRPIHEQDIAHTITTSSFHDSGNFLEKNGKIRRLSSRECWRLMGFSDTDYDRAAGLVSQTQLYKQAGNSIVVDVLMRIFEKML